MRKIFQFVAVMLFIFAASIFLTPPLHSILPMFKFEQIFDRLVMVFTIIAAVLFVLRQEFKEGGTGLRREFWTKNGFDFSAPWQKLSVCGFLCGSLAVAFIIVWQVAFGPRYLHSPIFAQDIVVHFVKGMLSGVVVGIVEEFFFRGFVFSFLAKKMPVVLAILLASAFYSLTHFFDNGQIFIPDNPSFRDAFRLLIGYAEPFQNQWHKIYPQFVGLFIFGVILCVSYLRSRSLFLPIGIHAGAVFAIKFQHAFVQKPEDDLFHPFYGQSPDYDGSFEWLALVFLGLIIWFVILPRLESRKS